MIEYAFLQGPRQRRLARRADAVAGGVRGPRADADGLHGRAVRGRRRPLPLRVVWPPEALEFFRDLEDNNDSEWFRANRRRYDEHVVAPARELADKLSDLGAAALLPALQQPPLPARARRSRSTSASRSATAPPAASTSTCRSTACSSPPASTTRPPTSSSGFAPRSTTTARRGASSAASPRRSEADSSAAEPELKRAPRGYPMDHPRIDRLRMKQLTVSRRHPLEPWLHEPSCDERVRSEMVAARPLVKWLAETVGPSTRPRAP